MDDKCTKRYTRDCLQDTQTGVDGYPSERRKPENYGFQTMAANQYVIDNKWTVRYSPSLLKNILCSHQR